MSDKYYLSVGRHTDLSSRRDRIFYRALEMMPGLLSWTTLMLALVLSWLQPVIAALFIILFDLYWLFRVSYFSFHLRAGHKKMREHERIDWMSKIEQLETTTVDDLNSWRDMYHLVVLPMYKEPIAVVRQTFEALAKMDYPLDRFIVVLTVEERAGAASQEVAKIIEKEFGDRFYKFILVTHPADIPGELAGKGSNETYALKKVQKEFVDANSIPHDRIIVSAFDVDTVIASKYFSCLTYHYLTTPDPTRSSFQPIPLYINNIWQASIFSRIFSFSSTFWHTMNQERPDRLITFSSHSMSFKALVEIGFKQVNVISEDSRIFWQCFFHYDGDYKVVPLYYPVGMDAVTAPTFLKTLENLYKQQRRWAYGMENIPYAVFGFFKNKKIALRKKISFTTELMEGHWSWATAPLLIFFLGWLPILLGSDAFRQSVVSYNLPQLTGTIMTFAMLGVVASVYFSLRVVPPRPKAKGKKAYLVLIFQWLILPLVMMFFSAMPALDAQTKWLFGKKMGFWVTEKGR